MTLIALDAAAKRLNPFLVLVALGLLLVDGLVGVSRQPPGAAPQRPAPVVPPASAVLSSDVAAALADMKDRD